MCAISKARGGRTPIELATGVAPTLGVGVAAAQLDALPEVVVPPEVAAQGSAAAESFKADAVKASLAKAAVVANATRWKRSKAAQASAKAAGRVPPVDWQQGMVAWIEAEPAVEQASKFNSKLRRTKLVVILSVDARRLRAKVADWETRMPYRGFVPFRRLSEVHGSARPAAAEVAASVQPAQARTKVQGTPGLQVMTDAGIIVDVQDTTDGRVVLLAQPAVPGQPDPDWSQPLLRIDADRLPTPVVREAWRLKQALRAPAGARRSARLAPASAAQRKRKEEL